MPKKYYGIDPSSDFFMHYGVKGMKWGIRRALAKGGASGAEALRKQYTKATKKLAKLSLKANNTVNEAKYKTWRKNARNNVVPGVIAGATGGALGTLHEAAVAGARHGLSVPTVLGIPGVAKLGALYTGAAALGGGLGGYSGARIRASVYKRRQKPSVRARNIDKRDAWQREMTEAFKNTKYGKKPMHQFQKSIAKLSETPDPKAYIAKQRRIAENDYKRALTNRKAARVKRRS